MNSTPPSMLFELVPHEQTQLDFTNKVEEGLGSNILESHFFYNGGGVAVGDVNGDELPDIYFTANTEENALYLNRGNFRFRDITEQAGVGDSGGWTAGTAMADINGDGLLDIYVCKAGDLETNQRRNKFFINGGIPSDEEVPVFTEEAAAYGLDDPGYCTQAVFLDYNLDGYLDLFIVNYSATPRDSFDIRTIRDQYDPHTGDRLYRNNGDGTFTDVSSQAGILQNPIGFGLSATAADLNGDGWPDLYVANDFMERDYMYINRGDGTFSEEVRSRTELTSYYSMGNDIADINNDGLSDILVVDMLHRDHAKRRVFRTPNYNKTRELSAWGYHRQYMRNTLLLNDGSGSFTEIGQMSGISATDWSWAGLLADFDNDGWNDIFVTNGFPRFYNHLDYLNQILWKEYPDENVPDDPQLRLRLTQKMQTVEMHNFAFRNEGDLLFTDVSKAWGVDLPSVSTGAAYADLNNDGALDLVVNNLNERPFIFRNTARQDSGSNYLKIRLQGTGGNSHAIGAKVLVTGPDGALFYRENYPVRGYQSSVDPVLHIGLGSLERVDVEVTWPGGSRTSAGDVAVNRTMNFQQKDGQPFVTAGDDHRQNEEKMFLQLSQKALGMDHVHHGSFFQEWLTTPLIPHSLSNTGPALATGDVNGDDRRDLFVGGGRDQPASIFLQQPDGTWKRYEVPVFDEHAEYQDTDALFFDATGNGHLDLYVASGGNHDPGNGPLYQDRLYLNDGFGHFAYVPDALPQMYTSTGKVLLLNLEDDGTPDIFVGGRVVTGMYPLPPRSYLLKNSGGRFSDVTEQLAPDLMQPGMVTGASWVDIDNDGSSELIVTGEWMPIRMFSKDKKGSFREITKQAGLEKTSGWWNVLKSADLNADGLPDLIAGNHGLNAGLHASPDDPLILYAGDFDGNGFLDPLITQVIDGVRYPLPDRDLLLRQIPDLSSRFPDYASYSTATITDVLNRQQRSSARRFYVHTFASTVFINNGDGTFRTRPLPRMAQISPVFDMIVADFYKNGIPDILLAGNNFGTRPEIGPLAGKGFLLKADGDFTFTPVSPGETGFQTSGDVRGMELIPTNLGSLVILGRYNDALLPYGYIGQDDN